MTETTAEQQPFILGQIRPEPTDQQRRAIELALAEVGEALFPSDAGGDPVNLNWRFSGRWWNRGGLEPNFNQ